ncbi:MAG: hypothetical protein ACK5NI_02535, partial [bacterium]
YIGPCSWKHYLKPIAYSNLAIAKPAIFANASTINSTNKPSKRSIIRQINHSANSNIKRANTSATINNSRTF